MLIHVLNACRTALRLKRYNERHDSVLIELHHFIKHILPPSISITADLDGYSFPLHIASTDLRPDLVCWDEKQKRVWYVELTVCYETCFQAAADRKEERYLDLACSTQNAGYRTQVITLEVGSRGLPNLTGFETLAHAFNIKDTICEPC